jgi:DNA-binding CsgD family transcriptional regulator
MAGAAAALRAAIGAEEASPFRVYVERRLERAWRASGEQVGAKAFEEGQALTPEEALSQARRALEHAAEEAPARGTAGGGLSAREVEVLRLISPRTVGVHLRSTYRKLAVPSRAAAVKEAVERGVIQILSTIFILCSLAPLRNLTYWYVLVRLPKITQGSRFAKPLPGLGYVVGRKE